MKYAALYLRSSKDRHDVAIDTQRQTLQTLAADRGLTITAEFSDVVESAKSEHRPAFQQMLRDLRSPTRAWDTILMIDHARLSRQPYVGHIFRHDCEKRGITVIFASMPELDPMSKMIMDSMMDAFAVMHSMSSKEKGMAGMAENVRQGYRAGGRAPRGYKLKKLSTGAVREGADVTKSVLEPSEEAAGVARYLKARANGFTRRQAKTESGLHLAQTSLLALEWNALTYAGNTVWNVHNEKAPGGGYKGNTKRKPRAEWHIKEGTHKALISQLEAETLLHRLETSTMSQIISQARRGASAYLLTGLLESPEGQPWIGNGKTHYRTKPTGGRKGRWLQAESVDNAVVDKLTHDMQSPAFIKALLREARTANNIEDPAKQSRADIVAVNKDISKAMELSLRLEDPGPALRKVDELEKKRKILADEITRLERDYSAQVALKGITEDQVKGLVRTLAEQIKHTERDHLKNVLNTLIDKIVLDPKTKACQIHYKIKVSDRLDLASPRGFEVSPVLRMVSALSL